MEIGEATAAVKAGSKITNPDYLPHGMWIEKNDPEKSGDEEALMMMMTEHGKWFTGFLFSHNDVFRTDWSISNANS